MKIRSLDLVAKILNTSCLKRSEVSRFVTDSRDVQENDLFIALPGENVDGVAFLDDVAKRGAVAAIVPQDYDGNDFGMELFLVENVLSALQSLAKFVISQRETQKIVAVTGSVGKTTTKELIGTLLKQEVRVATSPGNNNSQVGLPLSILNHTDGSEDVIVLEMGMTEKGNIAKLIEIAPPDIAVITSVTNMHIGFFENLEGIAMAKAEILAHPRTQIGIINLDVEHFNEVSEIGDCMKITFSTEQLDADYHLTMHGKKMTVSHEGEEVKLGILSLPGEHNNHNVLAAIVVAREAGVSWKGIKKGIPQLKLPERRFQKLQKEGVTFINDSYNAGPLSMKAAMKGLPKAPEGKKTIGVLGEMLELGKHTDFEHRDVANYALDKIDVILCIGKGCHSLVDEWETKGRDARWYPSRQELVEALKCEMEEGDVVLVKGSRGNQLWKVLEEL